MRYFKYFLMLMLGSLGVSCQKFLTKDPDLRQQISTVDNIKDLLGSAYPEANYIVFTEFSTDNMMEKQGVNLVTEKEYLFPFKFQDYPSAGKLDIDLPPFYWNSAYAAIAAANKALRAIAAAPQEEQKKLLPYMGEALICRAYAHFMLACFFAETYNPATAAQTEGIPYIDGVEDVAIKKYHRVNLAEVYKRIEEDLLDGLPLLSDGAYTVPKYHFGVKSAYAFATRFYLHKRDWDKVIQCADAIYPSDAAFTADIRPWAGRYKSYKLDALWINYTKATESANLLLASTYSTYGRYYFTQGIGWVRTFNGPPYITRENTGILDQLFAPGVFTAFSSFGYDVHNFIPKYKEYFKRVSVNANTGYTYVMVPLFVVEEVLFNKAEAQIMQGDTTDAIATLNVWAKMRIQKGSGSEGSLISENADVLTGAKINKLYGSDARVREGIFYNSGDPNAFIYRDLRLLPDTLKRMPDSKLRPYLMALLDLKRIEFVFDGIRWFDLMRYRLPVLHSFKGTVYPLGPNSKQRVFNIPTTVGLAGVGPTPR